VTVLFCDVVGSTALGESVDPEALQGLRREGQALGAVEAKCKPFRRPAHLRHRLCARRLRRCSHNSDHGTHDDHHRASADRSHHPLQGERQQMRAKIPASGEVKKGIEGSTGGSTGSISLALIRRPDGSVIASCKR
jgi:hypothetical protein